MPSSNESSSSSKKVRLTYCIGTPAGSGKGKGNLKGLNLSRTWMNKSLNKSRVVARSLRTNNRTLAKKLNTVQMELAKAEEQLTNLRDAHESLQQDNRLKESCLSDVFAQVGELTQGLVMLARRVEEGLGVLGPHSHLVATPPPPPACLPRVLLMPDGLEPMDMKLEIEDNPFLARDRIPRTPPFGSGHGDADRAAPAMSMISESPPKAVGHPAMLAEKMLDELMSHAGAVDEQLELLSLPVSPRYDAAGQLRVPTRIAVSPPKPSRAKPTPLKEEACEAIESPPASGRKVKRRLSAVEALVQMWPGIEPALGRRRSSLETAERLNAAGRRSRRRSETPQKAKRARARPSMSAPAVAPPVVDVDALESPQKAKRGKRETSAEAESPRKAGKAVRSRRMSIEPQFEPPPVEESSQTIDLSPDTTSAACVDLDADSPVTAVKPRKPRRSVEVEARPALSGRPGRVRKSIPEPPSEPPAPHAATETSAAATGPRKRRKGTEEAAARARAPDGPAEAGSRKAGKPSRLRRSIGADRKAKGAAAEGLGSSARQPKPRRSREGAERKPTRGRRSSSEPTTAELDEQLLDKFRAIKSATKGAQEGVISPIQAARSRPRLSPSPMVLVPDSSSKKEAGKQRKTRRSLSSPGKLSPMPRTIQVATKKPGVLKFSAQRHGMEEKSQSKPKKRGRAAKPEKVQKEVASGDAAPKTVYDFSLSDTMNKTGKLPPTLSEFREKEAAQTGLGKQSSTDQGQSADSVKTVPAPTATKQSKAAVDKTKKSRGPAKEKASMRPLHERQVTAPAPDISPAPNGRAASPHDDDEDAFDARPASHSNKRRFRRLVTFDDSMMEEESRPAVKRPRHRLQTAVPQDPSDEENKEIRSRRVKSVNYKEPRMNKKVRQGDPSWCRS